MARFRTPNFHDARLSLAQSLIRELVVKRTAGAAPSGLYAAHPIMQAASHVLQRVHQREITDAQAADAAYKHHRAMQKAQGITVSAISGDLETLGGDVRTILGDIESLIKKFVAEVESLAGTAERCADLATRYAIAWAMDDQAQMAEIRSEWTDNYCDVAGWAKAVEAWLAYYATHTSPVYAAPANAAGGDQPPYTTPGVFPLPPARNGETLCVGVLGDWGTGEPEAVAVLDQLMRQNPDVIVHVGDVYYAGTKDEQNSNFLNLINQARQRTGRNIPVYTLPGNHDYYCGGAPFYAMIPELNAGVPNASIQKNSFWALANERWQLEGMDTGYHDSDLPDVGQDFTFLRPDEAEWHREQLSHTAGRSVILFSHHQLVSAFAKIGGAWQNPQLEASLASWQEAGASIVAWLWGHEHLLEIYEPYQAPGSGFAPMIGRCMGNSAFPMFADGTDYTAQPGSYATLYVDTSPDGKITFSNHYVQTQPDDLVWASGYAVLQLPATGNGSASYYQVQFNGDVSAATSQLLWTDSIPGPA